MGPVVGDEVELLLAHRAGVGAEIGVQQFGDGTGVRHHAGVAGKAVGCPHEGHPARKDGGLGDHDVGAVDLQEGHSQFAQGNQVDIRLDIIVEDDGHLVEDVLDAHGAGPLEQGGVEIPLHIQPVDVRVFVALAVAVADEELGRCAVQVAVALGQVAAVVFHVVGDIHLDAAEVIHHFGEGLHIDGDVVVHRQFVLVVDDLGQGRDAAPVGQGHRVDLVVGCLVGLAAGQGDGAVGGGHQGVAGDLQHPQRPALDVELAVQDHVRHAVVGAVVGVGAALLIVDAADQDVHHIPLVLLEGLDLLHDGRRVRLGADALLHPVDVVHRVDHAAAHQGHAAQHHGQGQPQRRTPALFPPAAARAVAGRFLAGAAVPAGVGLGAAGLHGRFHLACSRPEKALAVVLLGGGTAGRRRGLGRNAAPRSAPCRRRTQ